MPAETHQQGDVTDSASVARYLTVLLDIDGTGEWPIESLKLADCGVTPDDFDWLWEAVGEELAERSLTPELDSDALHPAMTIAEAAAIMAQALGAGGEDDG